MMVDAPDTNNVIRLQVQVEEMSRRVGSLDETIGRGFSRIERKVDDNMESTMGVIDRMDRRLVEVEAWRREREKIDAVLNHEADKSFTRTQVLGIILGSIVGISSLGLTFISVVVAILVFVLH